MTKLKLFSILFYLLPASLVFGAPTIQLFTSPNEPVTNYTAIVLKLDVGDTIKFSNGRSFKIDGDLGGKSNTRIFLSEGEALRVATTLRGIGAQKEWTTGHEILSETSTPIPEVIESYGSEYIFVKKYSVLFDLGDYQLHKLDPANRTTRRMFEKLSLHEITEIESSLLRFASLSKEVKEIGDFSGDQLVYTKEKGWVLLDWNSYVKKATRLTDGHFLIAILGGSKSIYRWIVAIRFSDPKFTADCSDVGFFLAQ